MLTLLMALSATAAAPAAVDLTIEDRRALVYGLRSWVGGAFVLTGLAHADGLCRAVGACVTVDSLVARGDRRSRDPQHGRSRRAR